ncbi:hypothetical protein HGM15179_021208 [Zosterops borbonicus]|uniref:Interferon-induced very large GTPase 1 n=1 Tax=Zosterops borbonicus TaxID=364589 RepID=A0A8K1D877_9PASS|nr:hypothetical protein HGM15179_021208 [Zosterops borbonicus]
MAWQEGTEEGDVKAQLLAEAFQKEGLDAGYWLPKVTQLLGIKCREALQNMEYKDYLKLECEVRHPWEKKALQKLLKITDDKASEELQNQNSEKMKQRQEVAKQALKDLTEMLNSQSQDAVREKAEILWKAMEIPKEFWPAPKKPLAGMLEGMQKQLEQQELSAGKRENIPDTEVLRRASGGLALQGIYRSSRPEDVLAKREQLLRVPEGFQLSGPEQGSLLERKEFSSSAAESTFTKSMEQLGFSMSVSAKASFWGINLGVGVDHSSSSQSQDTYQSHSEQSYFCTTMYQYIPLASCSFQRHQLLLSDVALQELQDMEQFLSFTQGEDTPPLLDRCERFFSRFGSHVNQGPLHFGGIFWWKASTKGFRDVQREEMKRQMCGALNNLVRNSYGGFLENAVEFLDVSISGSKASVLGRAGDSSHSTIQLSVINTGGPPDTASLPQWKTGLVSDNTTWCVIDRGFELIPVWDVILCNHRGDFKSVGQMSRALRDAYKELTDQSIATVFGKEIEIAVQEARDFMGTVKAWEVTVDEKKLLILMELKDHLNAKTRSPSVWINVCLSDKALQDFLVNTVRSCQESPPENTSSIKVMLRSLLDPHIYSVKDFPETSFIMQWIFKTEHPLPRSSKVSELGELIKTLQQMKEHIHAIEPALHREVYERTAKDIADDMQGKFPDFQGNRANLEVSILRYLAEQENFEYFKCYLMRPKEFFHKFIALQVQNYCSDESRRLEKFLDSSLNHLYRNILSALSLSTQIVKDRNDREDKVCLWLDEFCRELSEVISLPRSDLKGIEHQEVTDIEFLSSVMADNLAALRDRLKKEFSDADMSSFSRQPHTILAEHFSGCWEQCPFCGAVCTNPMWNHSGHHEVLFHHPRALMGTMWEKTDHLSIDICSNLVATKLKFRFDNGKWIRYKRYRDAGHPFSTWKIHSDSSMQAYWKWFVCHFRTQLEGLYNGKFQGKGEIPEAWRRITKQEALSELDKH